MRHITATLIVAVIALGVVFVALPSPMDAKIAGYRDRLGGRMEIRVEVQVPDNMPRARDPHSSVIAHTQRIPGGGCLVTVSSAISHRDIDSVLAHEACHCVIDYMRLGPSGYRLEVLLLEIEEREAAAQACAERLRADRR